MNMADCTSPRLRSAGLGILCALDGGSVFGRNRVPRGQ